MTKLFPRFARRSGLLAALGVLLAVFLVPGPALAGVATAGAVLLDPFDPVPEIQFEHFGGYGCAYGCGGYQRCDEGCGYRRCHDRCVRHTRCDEDCRGRDRCDGDCHRADRCDSDCDHHDHCDRDCDRSRDDAPYTDRSGPVAPPCQGRCSDSEHWEHHWRNGDHVGQEYYDRGRRERDLQNGGGAPPWYGHAPDWHDNDDEDAPPPPPPPPPPH